MTKPQPPTGPDASREPLSEPLTRLLLRLSQGVHRFAIYPEDHPALQPAVESLARELDAVLDARTSLDITVGRRHLRVEGRDTDPEHPILGEFARRIHRQQISGLSFRRGAGADELADLLRTLGQEAAADEVPLGLRSPEELPHWPHARIHPLGVDRLVLSDTQGWPGEHAVDLWRELTNLAVGPEAASEGGATIEDIARGFAARAADETSLGLVSDRIAHLVAELRSTSDADSDEVRAQLGQLVERLDTPLLERIVGMGGDAERQRSFLRAANRTLPQEAVLRILGAAAASPAQSVSHSMTRLLSKLSLHEVGRVEETSGGGKTPVERAEGAGLYGLVDRLLDSWELADPNPQRYTAVLDTMARATRLFRERTEAEEERGDALAGALRIVQMGLEVGAVGTTVRRAGLDLIETGEITALVKLLEDPPPQSGKAAEAILDFLAAPAQLERLLDHGDVPEATLRALVERAGATAVAPLVHALAESDSRALRRRVFDALPALGGDIGAHAVAHLSDPRWFVQRNMLALLQRLENVPRTFDPLPFTTHGDHRVRREALPLALRDPASRDRALGRALSDRDEHVVRLALAELEDDLPPALIPPAVSGGLAPHRSDALRALAVRTLGASESALVCQALVSLVAPERSLWGRPRLADRSEAMLAALEVLRTRWQGDRDARAVVRKARGSRDPEVRRVAMGEPT